ncbi:MAG: MATE family efflux transporter, partial [Clostridia bacterium]|nr:MATE family efflux transporter [Clostridia bacterium]
MKTTKQRDTDMTRGNIVRHIIIFSIPLLVGNVFQQMYNTVDTWVVGNFTTNEAYSAVGSVGPVINMLIGIFLGLSSGAGVVVSQFYGAKQYDKVHNAVHTSLTLTFIMAVIFTILGIVMTPFMLQLMKMPEEVIP